MTIQQAKLNAIKELKDSPSPSLDVDCILQHLLGCDKTFLLFHRDTELSTGQEEKFRKAISKRKTGLPIAYITGIKEFYGRDFFVTPDVLIPKPDTEILVERAVALLRDLSKANTDSLRQIRILDMCTGSGCIGLSVLAECKRLELFEPQRLPLVTLADVSPKALEIAARNSQQIEEGSLSSFCRLVETNLFQNITGDFDLILSNPPYIPSQWAKDLLTDGRREPILALDGDIDMNGNPTGQNDGLGIIRNLVPQSYKALVCGGHLLVEAGEYNAEKTEQIFIEEGFTDTDILRDLEGQLRVIEGKKQ